MIEALEGRRPELNVLGAVNRDVGCSQILDRDLRCTGNDAGQAAAVKPIAGHGIIKLLQHLCVIVIAADKERALIGLLAVRPQRVADVHSDEIGGEVDLAEALALADQRAAGDQRAKAQLVVQPVQGRVFRVHPGRGHGEPLRPGASGNRRVLARIVFAKPAQHEIDVRLAFAGVTEEFEVIVALDDDIAHAREFAGHLPLVAEVGRDLDEALVDALSRPAVIEADRDRAVAVAVDEALDAIARDLVADRRLRHEIVFLAVHVDVRLQPVTPAVGEDEDLCIALVALVPLGIKGALALGLANAVEGSDRHVAAKLDFALDGRVLLLALFLLGELAHGKLGTEGERAADQAGGKRRAAEQRAGDCRGDSCEDCHDGLSEMKGCDDVGEAVIAAAAFGLGDETGAKADADMLGAV